MPITRRAITLGAAGLLGACAQASERVVATVALTVPDAELSHPFTTVGGVRELSDGRVLLIDTRDYLVAVANFAVDTVEQVGRNGDGPGEYRVPMLLLPLPGDSSVVLDPALGRMLILGPGLNPAGQLNRFGVIGPDTGNVIGRLQPHAIDGQGRWYAEAQPLRRVPGSAEPELADSAAIVRIDRETGRQDTVAYRPLQPDPGRSVRTFQGAAYVSSSISGPFPAIDTWAVAPDARIAFVHVEPYRVDFVTPEGRVTAGPEIPYAPVAVTEPIKAEYREERQKPALAISLGAGPRIVRQVTPQYTEPESWPDHLPPFLASAARFAPDGLLWVERTTAAGAPRTYDVIDGSGHVVRQVTLPPGRKLVGFGQGTFYTVRVDENDLQYLQRYRMPY